MKMMLPPEFQKSYRGRLNYPESLIPSNTAIYSSKLKSYRRRLDEAESELCLIDGKDDVAEIFEIPIIDLETHDGRGQLIPLGRSPYIDLCSIAKAVHSFSFEADQMARRGISGRSEQPTFSAGIGQEKRPKVSSYVSRPVQCTRF